MFGNWKLASSFKSSRQEFLVLLGAKVPSALRTTQRELSSSKSLMGRRARLCHGLMKGLEERQTF